MKGLLKYLSPFAPDQSGAAAVFYDLGGIMVICDAGGCTGNICGFDEPRWFVRKSAVFSAGLRDMDAILGRDKELVLRLKRACEDIPADFVSLIGTPVPAVIATDFRGLKKMAEKQCNLPVLFVECTGTKLYDEGASAAYMELFTAFSEKETAKTQDTIGVLGVTPLDTSDIYAGEKLKKMFGAQGEKVCCFSYGDGIESFKNVHRLKKNLVISPAGMAAAEYLKEKYQVPYEVDYPLLPEQIFAHLDIGRVKKVLIVHQQVEANAIRDRLRKCSRELEDSHQIVVATWFMLLPRLKEEQDVHLQTEEEFIRLVQEEKFDVIFGDGCLKRAIPDYPGQFVEISHFAVSGKCEGL